MRQKLYYAATVFFALAAMLFIAMVDNHIIFGIMALVSLYAMGCYAALSSNEKEMHIRSNADEDRPE